MPICMQGRLYPGVWFFLCLLASAAGQKALAVGPGRKPNSTLAFPLEPYQYSTVEAFPGLDFRGPLAVVSPPGETNRLFVVEWEGRIQVITNLANPSKTLFLDISSRVNQSGEGGLLGLAFHPGYQTNRYFFVYYTLETTTEAGTGFHDRLSRFEISSIDSNQASADSELPLITQFDEDSNHNGGDIHFGPDGYLYLSLGDEGGAGDSFNNSKSITNDFFSAILRIDVDHRPGSLAPNPPARRTTRFHPTTRSLARRISTESQSIPPMSAPSSGQSGCGIPGDFPSTRSRAGFTVEMSARIRARKSISSSKGATTGGTIGKAVFRIPGIRRRK